MPLMTHPGEDFYVTGYLDNPGSALSDIPTFFVLDVYGSYWFWPSWTHYDPPANPDIDYMLMEVPTGTTLVEVIGTFTWPDTGNDSASGLHLYGAMLNTDMTDILGRMADKEWGYGP